MKQMTIGHQHHVNPLALARTVPSTQLIKLVKMKSTAISPHASVIPHPYPGHQQVILNSAKHWVYFLTSTLKPPNSRIP